MPNSDDNHPDLTSKTLLLRLREHGNAREVAWGEFYGLYQPIISAFSRRLGASADETDELVQGVMQAFFQASPEFCYDPAKGRFRGYLKTCVCNKLRNLRRKQVAESARIASGFDVDDIAVDATWTDVWETEKLHRALAIVRERYATNAERVRTFRAFEMCTLLSRSAEDVAEQLKMTHESVRAAKSRVSKALKQVFDELDEITG